MGHVPSPLRSTALSTPALTLARPPTIRRTHRDPPPLRHPRVTPSRLRPTGNANDAPSRVSRAGHIRRGVMPIPDPRIVGGCYSNNVARSLFDPSARDAATPRPLRHFTATGAPGLWPTCCSPTCELQLPTSRPKGPPARRPPTPSVARPGPQLISSRSFSYVLPIERGSQS